MVTRLTLGKDHGWKEKDSMKNRKLMSVSLCLFDGGAGTGAAAAGAPAGDVTPGVNPADAGQGRAKAPKVVYGKQVDIPAETNTEGEEIQAAAEGEPTTITTSDTLQAKKAEFEKLISGDYKDMFDERVQGIINKRFKSAKQAEETVGKMQPLLDILGTKYGVEDGSVESIVKALENDTSFYEEAASAQGLSVEQYKHMQAIERENCMLRQTREAAERQMQAEQTYNRWLQESETMKAQYPQFDFESEITNPDFMRLLSSGVGVKAAYQATHMDDILGSAMQYTAQTVAKKQADAIRANAARPAENGISGQSGVIVKNDVSKLTAADRREIAKRAAMGGID